MAESVTSLLTRLLDRRYQDAARNVLRAVGNDLDSARVRAAQAEFEAEADRLARNNLDLTPDNPALRNLTAEIDAAMARAAGRIAGAADELAGGAIDAAAASQVALPLAMGLPASVLVGWNMVSADALAQLVAFQDNPAWLERLNQYRGAPADRINQIALRGFAAGWNPLKAARMIVEMTDKLPRSHANIMMRTLYLQSYKHAAAKAQGENRRLITRVRRMATLDNRVCMVCVALHGTEVPVGESVESHEQCRCVGVSDVAGVSVPFGPTGEDWFRGLPDPWQRQMMGASSWEAWKAGAIRIGDVVGSYQDDLYGTMLTERSLKDMLGGDEALLRRFVLAGQQWRSESVNERAFPHP